MDKKAQKGEDVCRSGDRRASGVCLHKCMQAGEVFYDYMYI